MGTLVNRAKMTVSGTPGTGTITLNSAVTGFQSFASAGVANGAVVSYVIEDGTNWEIGQGTYSSSGTTLARTTIQASSNGGSAISATSGAVVYITLLASDFSGLNVLAGRTAAQAFYLAQASGTVNLADSTQYDVVSSVAGNINTYWTSTIVGSLIEFTVTVANYYTCAIRTVYMPIAGRVFTVEAAYITNTSIYEGIAFGFDPITTTGEVDGAFSGSSDILVWRHQSGALYRGAGNASIGGLPYLGGAPTLTAGVPRIEVACNANGTVTVSFMQDVSGTITKLGTYTYTPSCSGFFVAGSQVNGVSGGAQVNVGPVGYYTGVAQQGFLYPPEMQRALVQSSRPYVPSLLGADGNAERVRATPSALSSLYMPTCPVSVVGAGDVRMNMPLLTAYLTANPSIMTSSVAYLSPTGNDGTAVLNNPNLPFQTLYAALNSPALLIIAQDGVYNICDYRYTDTAGGVPKLVIAQHARQATLRVTGDTIKTNTWTVDGTYGTLYNTTIASSNVASNGVQRVIYTDGTVDAFGFPARLPKFPTKALLSASGVSGWCVSGTTLTVCIVGVNLSSTPPNIRALYIDASTGQSAIRLIGSTLMIVDFVFDGVEAYAIDYNYTGSSYAYSNFWHSGCLQQFAPSYGNMGLGGVNFYTENARVHASQADGYNCDASGSTLLPFVFKVGCRITYVGDYQTYATSIDGNTATYNTGTYTNNQAVSLHCGYHADFGSVHEASWGEEIADVSTASRYSATWLVASVCKRGSLSPNNPTSKTGVRISGLGSASAYNRLVWLDSVQIAADETTASLDIDNYSSGKYFNSTITVGSYTVGSTAPASYNPEVPG